MLKNLDEKSKSNHIFPKNSFPKNPIHKVNYFLYVLIILLSILFTIGPIFLLILSSVFMNSGEYIVYVWSAVIALIIGALMGVTLMHVARTKRKFMMGVLIASIFSSAFIAIIIKILVEQSNAFFQIISASNQASLTETSYALLLSPILELLIILVMFNVVPLILMYLTKHTLE